MAGGWEGCPREEITTVKKEGRPEGREREVIEEKKKTRVIAKRDDL